MIKQGRVRPCFFMLRQATEKEADTQRVSAGDS